MSDENVSLEFFGEQRRRMQADMRDVRADQERRESELRADLAELNRSVSDLGVKLDNFAAAVDARFFTVAETMATNLELTINAINATRR